MKTKDELFDSFIFESIFSFFENYFNKIIINLLNYKILTLHMVKINLKKLKLNNFEYLIITNYSIIKIREIG